MWEYATLKAMAGNSCSGSEIAKALGKTRNAVAGKAHRQGIHLTSIKVQSRNSQRGKPKPHKSPEIPIIHTIPAKPVKTPPRRLFMVSSSELPKSAKTSPETGKTLLDRTSEQCCFIIGDVTSNSVICGEPVCRDSSWCENHWLACHAAA